MFLRIALVVAASFARGGGPGSTGEQLARGTYLVTVAGCNDCHTPMKMTPEGPKPDMDRMLSGHPETLVMTAAPTLPPGPWLMTAAVTNTAFAGPWGVSFTANLTPDRETGLGKWTVRNFSETIRTGRHLGRGREILPPMPIPMYKNFTDADWRDFHVPPVDTGRENRVPEPRPPAAALASAGS
jgi:hypothetical protein